MKLMVGHWYRFNDRSQICTGEYTGRQKGFECCVCGEGSNSHTFNIWSSEKDYETWGYGDEHMPELIEDLGTTERGEVYLNGTRKKVGGDGHVNHKPITITREGSYSGCNVCNARNYHSNTSLVGKEVDVIYAVHFGPINVTLCTECLNQLKGSIDETLGM